MRNLHVITPNILLVAKSYDDINFVVESLLDFVGTDYQYQHVTTQDNLENLLLEQSWDLVICNDDASFLETVPLLELIQGLQPSLSVIFFARHVSLEKVVDIMRLGARGYVETSNHNHLLKLVQQELNLKRNNITKRKQAEGNLHAQFEARVIERTNELSRAKNRVEAILNNSPNGILLAKIDLSIQQTNSSFNKLFACDADYYFEQSLLMLISEADILRVTHMKEDVLREENSKTIEIQALRHNGTLFDAELSIGYIRSEIHQEVGLVCTFRDITQRKETERQLKYHASVQENIIDAVIVNNMQFHIQTWNKAAERIYGWRAEEVVGKLAMEVLRTEFESQEQFIELSQNFLKKGSWSGDVRHHHKDGTLIEIFQTVTLLKDDTGTPYGMVTIMHDITDRKKAERIIAEERNLLRTLIDTVPDYIYIKDTQSRIVLNNIAHRRSLKIKDSQAVIGKTDFELFSPELAEQFHADEMEMFRTGRPIFNKEERSIGQNGEEIWASTTKVPLKNLNGDVIGLVGITHDVSFMKHQEDLLWAKIDQEREFQGYLKELHEITIELMQVEQLDDLYKQIVEMGRKRLGFDRMALFLYDKQKGIAQGTFGTDETGNTIDEHHIEFVPNPSGILIKSLQRDQRFYLIKEAHLQSDMKTVGFGWNAAVTLWRGNDCMGWLIIDNLLHHKEASKALLDIFTLYGLTVDTLLVRKQNETARKRVEQALSESEKRFRLFVEVAPIAIVVTNQQGVITLVNERSERLFGYLRSELIGQPIEILMMDSVRQSHIEDVATYMQSPRMRRMGQGMDIIAQRKNGDQFPVEIELGYIETQDGVFVMSFVMDITEQQEREHQLRYHASLQKNVTDAVISTDLNFTIKSWNRAAERLYGWLAAEVIGKSINGLLNTTYLSDHDDPTIRNDFLEKGFWTGEVVQSHKDGTKIHILASVVLFKDDKNRPFGIVAVNHDISETKKVEQALRQALIKEKELNDLKSRFVSMASHEFRTPLATIQAMADTMITYRYKMNDEQINQKLYKINDQVGHLKDIMEDVLKLARMQARQSDFNPTLLNLDVLCKNVLEEFQSLPSMEHHFEYLCEGVVREYEFDPKLMRQIISNLITNAIKYSSHEKTIYINLAFMADGIVLRVRDEGIGIPEEDLKHIFEPFHRASNVGTISGTGLGLVITKESIERHHGIILIESQLGVGTTFIVQIPFIKNSEKSHGENPGN